MVDVSSTQYMHTEMLSQGVKDKLKSTFQKLNQPIFGCFGVMTNTWYFLYTCKSIMYSAKTYSVHERND